MPNKRFEELRVWRLSSTLAVDLINLTRCNPLRKEWELNQQLRRAVVSISTNIAEGYERNSQKELMRFLYISRGSCGEVRSLLYLYKELQLIEFQEYEKLRIRLLNLSCAIFRFIDRIEKNLSKQK